VAIPVTNEHAENARVARISGALRDPSRSERAPMPKAGQRPGEGQPARQEAHLRIVQPQLRLNEGHEEVQRVAIEQHEAEIQAQERRQHHLVGCGARRGLRFHQVRLRC
jgi:hypothetical protein